MRARDFSAIGTTFLALLTLWPGGQERALGQGVGSANAPAASGLVGEPVEAETVGPPAPPLYHADRLEVLLAQADSMPTLTSLLIARRDSLIVERYYGRFRPDQSVNVKSVSKTLLSPMVGIAIRDGLLDSVDQPLAELLPDYYEALGRRGALDPRKEDLRLRHLLSMRTGLETTSFRNYGAWVASSDWAYDQLRRPMVCDPDECHVYSTGATHLLGVILARRAGKSLRRYMIDELFHPLSIPLGEWDRDPQGRYLGGNNMSLRPRDMLKFGQLFLDGGSYGGRQLVPESWIRQSWTTVGNSPWNGHGYGYLWWTDTWGGERAYFAWGYGGQYIVVVPALDLVVVVTSSAANRSRGYTRRLRRFFDYYVVPAFRVGWGADPIWAGGRG